jgi:DNA-binding PadR family transcriptional regulator
MLALNFAVLKYFSKVEEADANAVMQALANVYSRFRAFKKKTVIEALMTASENGLLDETRFELDDQGELRVYYRANEYGLNMIRKYIKGDI